LANALQPCSTRNGTEVALPHIVPITDPSDPRIADYRDVRERDLVGREGLFIAEGEVVVKRLIASARHETLSLLVAEKRVAGLMPALEALPPDVPVYAAGQAVMDGIVGFHIHRGILALGRPKAAPSVDELLASTLKPKGGRALVVVLVGLANHDNVGGVFRNAAAFGADAVVLDAECCDPLYRKATRVSVGATLLVPYARLSRDADPVTPLVAAGFQPIALTPAGATPLPEMPVPERAALILGPEGPGLDEALVARCQAVRIQMAAGLDSLNVATASGIALHHFAIAAGS
jgi:tRNA G18 (ribose-2'-O)-methylase SpoU